MRDPAEPVVVGSGVRRDTAHELLDHADALIVGSWQQRDGQWQNPPDFDRAVRMVKAARG